MSETTLEDVRVEMANLAGEIREATAVMRAHVEEDRKIHKTADDRLSDHGERLRKQEAEMQSHKAGHFQMRVLAGFAISGTAVVVGLWERLVELFSNG